jgi:hypothetical protein
MLSEKNQSQHTLPKAEGILNNQNERLFGVTANIRNLSLLNSNRKQLK